MEWKVETEAVWKMQGLINSLKTISGDSIPGNEHTTVLKIGRKSVNWIQLTQDVV
jgi:hypothetical protein